MRQFVETLIKWTQAVYLTLAAIWFLVMAWQVIEHQRVRQSARAALINRSQDITTTLGLVVRSQRRFGGMVSQDRLESALTELLKAGEMNAVALLNATGEVVASAGPPIDPGLLPRTAERWEAHRVTFVNPVDLGANVLERGETNRPTIVLPRRDPNAGPPPSPPGSDRGDRVERERDRIGPTSPGLQTNDVADSNSVGRVPSSSPPSSFPGRERDRGEGPRFGRPPFRMGEEEYKALLERRGLHGLVIVMSTHAVNHACTQDLWMRSLLGLFATVAVAGLILAWRNLLKSSELQMRLLRASELTTHLKEMNLAAAGLAHETRNPLNIIRGLAQMIGKQQDASPEIRSKTHEIIRETDRVTGQLNEFINYSRPRDVRRAAVPLGQVVGEVARALTHDLEEKAITLRVPDQLPVISADEPLLRQALFNLLLNAVQATGPGGEIQVVGCKEASSEMALEIRDNGHGVPPEHRTEIFKPYFTTHQEGTGLGLAVVQQIVLAHGWEIECVPNSPKGAIFRISHLRTA
jgi:signal transduction histidine kinase